MGDGERPSEGIIGWIDLTVPDAERIRDFYSEVVGWQPSPVGMNGYDDFNMNVPSTGKPASGICHARGSNADLPPLWLIYITVEDLDRSLERCTALGGEVLVPPKGEAGQGRHCVIRDPAGAVAALYEPATG